MRARATQQQQQRAPLSAHVTRHPYSLHAHRNKSNAHDAAWASTSVAPRVCDDDVSTQTMTTTQREDGSSVGLTCSTTLPRYTTSHEFGQDNSSRLDDEDDAMCTASWRSCSVSSSVALDGGDGVNSCRRQRRGHGGHAVTWATGRCVWRRRWRCARTAAASSSARLLSSRHAARVTWRTQHGHADTNDDDGDDGSARTSVSSSCSCVSSGAVVSLPTTTTPHILRTMLG